MTRNIEGVRRDSRLLRLAARQARRSGKPMEQLKIAQMGDAMGIPVGRTSNDGALEGAAADRYGMEQVQQRRAGMGGGLDAYDNRHSSESGVGVGGYDFNQRGNQSLRASAPRGGSDPLTDSFRSAWQSASTQEEKDRIVEDADAQGVPLSSAGQAILARRQGRPAMGAQGPTGPAGTPAAEFQGPLQPGHNVRQASAEPALLPPAETEQVLLNRKVDSLRSYFTPEATAEREAAKAAALKPYDDRLTAARAAREKSTAETAALPGVESLDPNGATAKALNPDGTVNPEKVEATAAAGIAQARGLERRNQEGMAGTIGRMEAERDIEAINKEKNFEFFGPSMQPRAPGTDPLPAAKATWQRLYPKDRMPDRRQEGFAAIDAVDVSGRDPLLDAAKETMDSAGQGLRRFGSSAKNWFDRNPRRPVQTSRTGSNLFAR